MSNPRVTISHGPSQSSSQLLPTFARTRSPPPRSWPSWSRPSRSRPSCSLLPYLATSHLYFSVCLFCSDFANERGEKKNIEITRCDPCLVYVFCILPDDETLRYLICGSIECNSCGFENLFPLQEKSANFTRLLELSHRYNVGECVRM